VTAPNADGATAAGERVRAQSVFLYIAIDILYHGENGENAAIRGYSHGQTCRSWNSAGARRL